MGRGLLIALCGTLSVLKWILSALSVVPLAPPQSALPYPHALWASYNPLLLLQLTLISRRVSCLLLMYAIQCMHRPNVELSVLHEI